MNSFSIKAKRSVAESPIGPSVVAIWRWLQARKAAIIKHWQIHLLSAIYVLLLCPIAAVRRLLGAPLPPSGWHSNEQSSRDKSIYERTL
jgi:hypothetical protein